VSIWFISPILRPLPDMATVTLHEGENEDDYYDKVKRLTITNPDGLPHSVHDEIILAIDELVSFREYKQHCESEND
jgi:hypothetical protein